MLRNIIKALIVISILGYLFSVVISFISPEVLLPSQMQALGLKDPKAPSPNTLYMIAVLSAIPILVLIYGFVNLFKYISDNRRTNKLKLFGYAIVLFGILRVVMEVLGTYLLVRHLPAGERTLSISYDSSELVIVLFGLLIVYIAKQHFTNEDV